MVTEIIPILETMNVDYRAKKYYKSASSRTKETASSARLLLDKER